MDSIRSKEDIVSLHNGREWATFDGGVETMIGQVDHLLQKVFRCEAPPLQVGVPLCCNQGADSLPRNISEHPN